MIPQGLAALQQQLPSLLGGGITGLPGMFRDLLITLSSHLSELHHQVQALTQQIEASTGRIPSPVDLRKSPVSVRSLPPRCWQPSVIFICSTPIDNWRPGWV